MGFFDLFKKKSQTPESPAAENQSTADTSVPSSKDGVYEWLFEQMSQRSPSQHFAQGSVFDMVRNVHSIFETIVRKKDVSLVHIFFTNAYLAFCEHPENAGFFNPNALNVDRNDTNPQTWNTDIIGLKGDDVVALCFMPVQDQTIEARIIGIVIGEKGDGYYYCNLKKDKSASSDVMRNKAQFGIKKAGEVQGRGFELMEAFTDCISNNYYAD
jgi:hypothetical protein